MRLGDRVVPSAPGSRTMRRLLEHLDEPRSLESLASLLDTTVEQVRPIVCDLLAMDILEATPEVEPPLAQVFRSVDVSRVDDSVGPLFSASAVLRDTRAMGRSACYPRSGGMGRRPEEARARAIGEGLERHCASLPGDLPPPRSWVDIGEEALRPSTLTLFSPAQYASPGFPYHPPRDDRPLHWVRGHALGGESELWIPAALVHMPHPPTEDELPILPELSHGLACGPSLEAALLSGLCELVERDAFTLWWLHRRSAPRIPSSSIPEGPHRELLDGALARGWRVEILDLRVDLPLPVFLVIGRPGQVEASGDDTEEARGPRFWLGAAASPDPLHALYRALLELFQNHRGLVGLLARERTRERLQAACDDPTFAAVDTFEAHAAFYSLRPDLLAHLDFASSGEEIDFRDIACPPPSAKAPEGSGWSALLVERGFSPCYCDLTTPQARGLGLHVVRVVVPELVPLHLEHGCPFLGNPRARGPVNPWPHPFP